MSQGLAFLLEQARVDELVIAQLADAEVLELSDFANLEPLNRLLGTRVPPFLGLLRCHPNGPEKLLPGFHFQLLNICKWSQNTRENVARLSFSINEILPVVQKKQHIVDEASFFVVEMLST